ncbi:MAG: hypothetical protein ABSF09_06995 [Candidatus Bathyarchaeia archaeon]|jgi:hypothetical protein
MLLADIKKVDYTPEVQEQLLRFTAKEMGFDIEHPKDRGGVIAIGIKDMNQDESRFRE